MSRKRIEAAIKSCYSTWSDNYYTDYYTNKAAYPPIHREIVRKLLLKAKAKNVLDAGCGPASMLRDINGKKIDRFGFDLTPEMVEEGNRILRKQGESGDRIWRGSVLSAKSFRAPLPKAPKLFDAALCIGVFPHIPEESDLAVMKNLRAAVKPGGLVAIEARNKLFSLFTLNRYSHDFFCRELIGEDIKKRAKKERANIDACLSKMKDYFQMDMPPIRKGKKDEPGYDQVLSRTHNPLVLKEQFASLGFRDVRVLFYHFHALPPLFERQLPKFFRTASLAMEERDDWRGYFMASAFLLVGTRA